MAQQVIATDEAEAKHGVASGRTVVSTDVTLRYAIGRVEDGMKSEMWVEKWDWPQPREATSTNR